MFKKNAKSGITLTEAVIVCLITGFLAISAADMISSSFESEIAYSKNIRARQYKNVISEMISSQVKEASKAYYHPLTLSIPFKSNTYTVLPEENSLAVLIPKFDSNGNIIQPSSGTTTFTGIAFSIISDPDKNDGSYILIETNTEFNLATNLNDPFVLTGSLPTDWGTGTTYVIADNLIPAFFTNLGNNEFDVEGDMVNFAFVPKNGNIYFSSNAGSLSINDGEYLTRCKFRNFRI